VLWEIVYKNEPENFEPKFEIVSCYVEYNGDILILHRQDYKPEGNTWGLPAGKIDEGEDKISAMLRELEEETGIKKQADELKFLETIYVKYPEYHFIYHIKLNEMLSYDRKENEIYLHLSPSETFGVSEKVAFLKRGFSKLTQILKADPSIEKVVAVSWIVTVNPGIMEKLGFVIDGPVSHKEQVTFRDVENRVISRAHIKREEFLKIHC